MNAKPKGPGQDDLFPARLAGIIDRHHERVKLAALTDREVLGREWAGFFPSEAGRPATPSRPVAGLLCLRHARKLWDEAVHAYWTARRWVRKNSQTRSAPRKAWMG